MARFHTPLTICYIEQGQGSLKIASAEARRIYDEFWNRSSNPTDHCIAVQISKCRLATSGYASRRKM